MDESVYLIWNSKINVECWDFEFEKIKCIDCLPNALAKSWKISYFVYFISFLQKNSSCYEGLEEAANPIIVQINDFYHFVNGFAFPNWIEISSKIHCKWPVHQWLVRPNLISEIFTVKSGFVFKSLPLCLIFVLLDSRTWDNPLTCQFWNPSFSKSSNDWFIILNKFDDYVFNYIFIRS